MKKVILPLLVAASAALVNPAQALVTVNFQFLNYAGGTVPTYAGQGVPGLGTGTHWDVVPDPNNYYGAGIFASTNSLADDGTTATGIGMTINTPGNYSSPPVAGSIALLDSWAAAGANLTGSFTITNIPSGTYNLALFGANGVYHGNFNKFTVNGVSLIGTNNSDTAFVLNGNYVVFSNIVVTAGQIAGTWTSSATPSAESDFNGAQLQQVSLSNPFPGFAPNPPAATPATALYKGANVILSTTVSGNTPIHLQWQVNKGGGYAKVSASATNSTLSLPNIQVADAGSYRLAATNTSGGAVSQPVVLTVDGSQTAFTANYQWISADSGGTTPVYTGHGVPGYGSGTYWNTVPGPTGSGAGAYTSTNSFADDGATDTGVTMEIISGGSQSTTPGVGSLSLLDSYANAYDGNSQIFIFNNPPSGTYNLILFGDNGIYHGGNITTYTVNSTSQTLTNNYTDNALIQNVTYVILPNLQVTGGLSGTWQGQLVKVGTQIEGNLTGAQLQLVGPIVNTTAVTITIQPVAGGQVQLSWPQGNLYQSPVLGSGALWLPVVSGSPYTTSTTGAAMYYRVQ